MTRAVDYDLASPHAAETALAVSVAALQRGECIVINVDGTWCIAADAFSAAGTASLLHARGRGRGAPLPVLVKNPATAHALWADVNADAAALMRAFWPGPLTLIGRPAASLAWDLAAAGTVTSVGLRMPRDAFAIALLAHCGPLAHLACPAGSSIDDLRRQIGDDASVYVRPAADLQSAATTVVDVRGYAPVLVRHGQIDEQEIRRICPALADSAG